MNYSMQETPLLDSIRLMEKKAGLPGKLLSLGFGTMAGASLGKGLADIFHKGPVGIGSEEKWRHELAGRIRQQEAPENLARAYKAKRVGGLLGTGGGILSTLPFALHYKKPLLPVAGALLGHSLGRWIAKKKHPLAGEDIPAIDMTLAKYRNLMTGEEARRWQRLLTSEKLAKNPKAKAELVGIYRQLAQSRPEYQSWKAKQSAGSLLGGIAGAGGMLAAMLLGKKPSIAGKNLSKYKRFLHRFSGSTYWPWLALGGLGLGSLIGRKVIGGKRAQLPSKHITKETLDRAMSDLGQELLWFGGLWKPSMPGAI